MAGVKIEQFEAYGELEPYQARLAKWLTPLVGVPEIKSGQPAMPWPQSDDTIDALLKSGKVVNDPTFETLTGWTHARLLNRWKTDRTSTCNEFVKKAANVMGFTQLMMGSEATGLGRFDVADMLLRIGLGHCWVDANSGATPEFGDLFRLLGDEVDKATGMRKNHMGVSLSVDGAKWNVAEGGQGGSIAGQDKVKLNTHRWKPADLTRWVSMRAVLNVRQQIPSWLGGWWEVTEDVYPGYYFFSGDGKVCWSMFAPPNPTFVPGMAVTVGSFEVPKPGNSRVLVHWRSGDQDEEWEVFEQDSVKRSWRMVGKTKDGRKLSGKRIMLKGAFDRVPAAA